MKYNDEEKGQLEMQRRDYMTDEEITEINDNIAKLLQNKGDMEDYYDKWSDHDKIYRGDQDKKDGIPNTRVNIVNAVIESQVANLVDKNIAVTCMGEGISDQGFASWARIGLDWTFRKNRIKKILAVHERRRSLFGNAFLRLHFNPDAINGFGLVEITSPPLNKIYVDSKIKDHLRFQEADYIAETITMSRQGFEEMYGEEKASLIYYGSRAYEDITTFNERETQDDIEDAATLILWWSRHKGKLRLQEFSGCGLLLYDSHKTGERTDNQKDSKYTHESYYEYVNERYPYFFTQMYPEEGALLGFGEGQLLKPLQDMLNDLYDKIRMAARPNLLLVNYNSDIDLEDFDQNSFEPRPANLDAGRAVEVVPYGNINESWWRLLVQVHEEIQRVARTSYLMLGQGGSASTATEAAIQQQQGSSASDHKKLMLQETLIEMSEYALAMMMQFYTEGKTFRIDENKEDYEWIDYREMTKVPVKIPATRNYIKKFKEKHPGKDAPKWQVLTDSKGNAITKNVDLDIKINIGAGLPANKAFLYQMAEKLSQMIVDGQHVIHYNEMRKFIKDFLGMPLEEIDEQNMEQKFKEKLQQMDGGAPQQSPNTEGLSEKGRPQMSRLPLTNEGGGLGV